MSGRPGIELLCDMRRVPSRWVVLLLIAYLPIGALLLFGRVAALVALPSMARLLPPRHRRALYPLLPAALGLRQRWSGRARLERRRTGPCVLIYNHVSLYDSIVLVSLERAAIMSSDPRHNSSRVNALFFGWIARSFDLDVRIIASLRSLISMLRDWKQESAPNALCVAPEGTVGNGKALFAFQKTFFALDVPILPVCIRVEPALPVAMHPVLAHHALNFLWPLFLPWVTFHLDCLEPMAIADGQTPAAFAAQVQARMAAHLGIPTTNLGPEDKRAYRSALRARGNHALAQPAR